jgi:hypothetical protein
MIPAIFSNAQSLKSTLRLLGAVHTLVLEIIRHEMLAVRSATRVSGAGPHGVGYPRG